MNLLQLLRRRKGKMRKAKLISVITLITEIYLFFISFHTLVTHPA